MAMFLQRKMRRKVHFQANAVIRQLYKEARNIKVEKYNHLQQLRRDFISRFLSSIQ